MPLCPRVQRREQKDLSGEAARPSAAARASLSDHAHLANQFLLFGITGFRDRSLAQAINSRVAHRTIVVGRNVTLSVNGAGGIIVIVATIAIHPSGKCISGLGRGHSVSVFVVSTVSAIVGATRYSSFNSSVDAGGSYTVAVAAISAVSISAIVGAPRCPSFNSSMDARNTPRRQRVPDASAGTVK
jgi:hypothetical protein